MKIWFKRILISLVVLVIVALVGLAIFLLTFNPNAYKTNLQNLVFQNYQRTLTINGDIELSLFPRLGLAIKDVALSNQNAPDTFVSVESARLAVAIWPLLSNRFLVDHVSVSGFRAWVKRDESGRFNFHDLMTDPEMPVVVAPGTSSTANVSPAPAVVPADHSPDAAQSARSSTTLPSSMPSGFVQPPEDFHIDIAGLDLGNGEIHFHDALTGTSARLLRLSITTGRVTAEQPFDVTLKGQLVGDQPVADASLSAQAVVQFSPAKRTYSAQRVNVQMTGRLAELQAQGLGLRAGRLVYDAVARNVSANAVEFVLQGDVGGEHALQKLDTRLQVPQLRFDRSRALFSAEKLSWRLKGVQQQTPLDIALDAPRLAISPDSASGEPVVGTFRRGEGEHVLGIAVSASGLSGNAFDLALKDLKLDTTYRQGRRLVRKQLVSPARWQPFDERGSLSAIKGDIHIEDPGLPGGEFSFPFIGSLQADLRTDELTSQINAVLSGSPLDLSIKATEFDNPRWVVALKSDSLDLDQLFPVPVKASAAVPAIREGGVQNGAGPGPSLPSAAREARAAEPAAEPRPGAPVSRVDFSFLQSLNLSGTLTLGALKTRNVRLQAVQSSIKVAEGVLRVSGFKARAYEGELAGSFSATSDNQLSADLGVKGLALGPFLTDLTGDDRIAGSTSLQLKIQTSGTTLPAFESNLSGALKGTVRDGAIKGFNVAQTLREVNEAVRAVLQGQVPSISATYDPSRRTDFTSLDLDLGLAQGQGTVRKLTVMAPLLRITQGKPASLDLVNDQIDLVLNVNVVNTRTGQEGKDLADLRGITVPLRVSGPFRSPGYQVQWQDISSKAIRQAVQGGLTELLTERLGLPVPEQESTAPGASAQPPAAPRPVDPDKSLGDALKGLLR